MRRTVTTSLGEPTPRSCARRSRVSSLLALALLALATPRMLFAQSEPGELHAPRRWVPALAIMGGLALNRVDASAASFDSMGTELRKGVDADDVDATPFIGLNIQLMTPTLFELPGRPRLFLSADIPVMFGVERNIAREGAANGFRIPLAADGMTERPGFSDSAIAGQGSRTTATVQNQSYAAGIGLAFSFEMWGRSLRLKPQLGWRRYEVDVVGQIFDAICTPVPPDFETTQCSLLSPIGQRRLVHLGNSRVETYDAIGPGLELEMDATRLGPFGVSVYIEGRAYHILGNRDLRLTDSTTAPADPPAFPSADDFTGVWEYSVSPWVFHTALGIRFSWLGN